MAEVFLSYSRIDTSMMQSIRDGLRAAGLDVWTDEHLEPGTESWPNEIATAIKQARTFVVLMSPDACKSKWVNIEIGYAETHNVHRIPLLVRGEEQDSVPIELIRIQRIDYRFDPDRALERLISSLKSHLRLHFQMAFEEQKSNVNTGRITSIIKEIERSQNSWHFTSLEGIVSKPKPKLTREAISALETGAYPYYGATGVIDERDGFSFEGEFVLLGNVGANLRTRALPTAFKASGRFSTNGNVHVLEAKSGVLVEYLVYYLRSVDWRIYVSGDYIPHLNWKDITYHPVKLPPIEIQRLMVEVIDAQTDLIDQAIDALDIQREAFVSLQTKLPRQIILGDS